MATASNEISVFPLASKVRMHLSFQPELQVPQHIEEEVERLWERAKDEKEVYNHPIFCLVSHDDTRIFGRFTEYRYFVATMYNPELRSILDIYPVGVSGITVCDDQVLVGTRDSKLALYGGHLELVPSGGIEPRACQHSEVDFFMQLMWELEEEAHIPEKLVKEIHPIALFYSPDVGVYDIGIHVSVDLKDYEMIDLEGTQEYPILRWMDIAEWEHELKNPRSKVVPLSRALWKSYVTRSQ